MEKELFDYSGWDGDQELMTFYNAKLKQKIGKFPSGSDFASAVIDFRTGRLQLYSWGGNNVIHSGTFKIGFVVGEEVII